MPAASPLPLRGLIEKAQRCFLPKVQANLGWGLEWTSLIGKRAISVSEPRSLSENSIRDEVLLLYATGFPVESYVHEKV